MIQVEPRVILMNDEQMRKMRQELEAEAASLRSLLDDMPEDFSRDDWDNLDVGTLGNDYQDVERKSRVRHQVENRLKDIEETIRQLDEGTYGRT